MQVALAGSEELPPRARLDPFCGFLLFALALVNDPEGRGLPVVRAFQLAGLSIGEGDPSAHRVILWQVGPLNVSAELRRDAGRAVERNGECLDTRAAGTRRQGQRRQQRQRQISHRERIGSHRGSPG